MEQHLVHWETVYDDVERFARERFPYVLDEVELFWRMPWEMPPDGPADQPIDTLMAYTDPRGGLRHMVILFANTTTGNKFVISAYPFATRGIAHKVKIMEVEEWEYGIEGRITGVVEGGPMLSFFDPLWFRNRFHYQIGKTFTFALSGLAYHIDRADPADIEVEDEDQAIQLRRRLSLPPDAPVILPSQGAAILAPMEEWEIDEYGFQGPLKVITPGETAFGPAVRLDVAISATEQKGDIDLPIYMTGHALAEGYVPEVGQDVTGAFWLQGVLQDRGEG